MHLPRRCVQCNLNASVFSAFVPPCSIAVLFIRFDHPCQEASRFLHFQCMQFLSVCMGLKIDYSNSMLWMMNQIVPNEPFQSFFIDTVYPTETQGFFYCIIVLDALLVGWFFSINQPDFMPGVEILWQPVSPLSSCFYFQDTVLYWVQQIALQAVSKIPECSELHQSYYIYTVWGIYIRTLDISPFHYLT